MISRTARRLLPVAIPLVTMAFMVTGVDAASAHPLGNFTVNHYDGLRLFADRVEDHAVVDTAEIPTLQERTRVDADHNGQVSDTERAGYAGATCRTLAGSLSARVDGRAAAWSVTGSRFGYRPGAANLQVSRLECDLTADARLEQSATLDFTEAYLADRLGWREITAAGSGVHLVDSPVPARSVSQELTAYPNDLLSSPLDVRSAHVKILPGEGVSTFGAAADLPVAGPVARALNRLALHFESLVGATHLTFAVGLLAVLLSLVLGASHAALPGHGKTVIAAYIAGRRGSMRDAFTVGATVTVTHTAGVIVLGLLLSAVATLAGDQVLGYLGVASGLLIAGIGAWLLRSAVHTARAAARAGAVIAHDHDHAHAHAHAHAHHHAAPEAAVPEPAVLVRTGSIPSPRPEPTTPIPQPMPSPSHGHDHDHGPGHGHGHGHASWTADTNARGPIGRASLIGMGIAGGLVPSPSALVVLLGAISLGRTAFGVLLVLCYGIGMAGTLTAVGLLLVHLRGRLDEPLVGRFGQVSARLAGLAPGLTALLVLVVGLGLTVRGLYPLIT
jgi:nickel/cobalt transporter (NicO) family protein